MNLPHLPSPLAKASQCVLRTRRFFGRQQSRAFADAKCGNGGAIEQVYVINLDRQPERWTRMIDE